MKFDLTKHAQEAINERNISIEWIERAFYAPELVLPDPVDITLERRFCRIAEFNGRVLRVVVNTTVDPNRVVSVFFDRQMRGKL
jgi:uncharacterized DUF497 family protein